MDNALPGRVMEKVFGDHLKRADELSVYEKEVVQDFIAWLLERDCKGQFIAHKVAGHGLVEKEIRSYRGKRKV